MKKSNIFLSVMAAGCLAAGLASCSNKSAATDADSVSDSAVVAEENDEFPDYPVLTPDSLGAISIGMSVVNIPADIPGLYASFTQEQTPDAIVFIFSDSNGVPLFTAYDFGEGKVDMLSLNSSTYGIGTPEGDLLHIGDDFESVLQLPEVRSEWAGMDENGEWYWRWSGFWFGVDEAGLNSELAEALCDSHNPPRSSLFSPAVKIGYIGTGLPF